MRIAIIGSPRAGKTTLALDLGRAMAYPVLHADDLIALGWSEASDELARVLTAASDIIVEGVAVVRALRKMLAASREPPVERCFALEEPLQPLTRGQVAMLRGCATVLRDVEPELRRRGVCVVRPTRAPAVAS